MATGWRGFDSLQHSRCATYRLPKPPLRGDHHTPAHPESGDSPPKTRLDAMPAEITEKQDVNREEARRIETRSPGEGVSAEHETKPAQTIAPPNRQSKRRRRLLLGALGALILEYLRRGLGEALILFSLFGGHARSVADAGARVDRIVQRLLEKADRERWWSLSRDFQLLAEAAPETFLAMLDDGLARDAPVTVLFGEDGGPFGGEHVSNLLWALESLAWSPQYHPDRHAGEASLHAEACAGTQREHRARHL
jgi:hypothetical protein